MRYQILSIDVWAGESKGEWERNNFFKVGEIEIDENVEGKDIRKLLKRAGYLSTISGVAVDEISDTCIDILRARDGYPLYHLQAV